MCRSCEVGHVACIGGAGGRQVTLARPRRTLSVDQYYWLTAFLAAREMQTPTCRLIAGVTFCLGLIPLLLMVNAEARTLPHLLSAVAITVCCTVVAGMWLRRCWPSRAQSRLAVVIGSACITLACLIQADPLVGLLGCTAFLVPTVFIGFFHSARLLALAWTVAAATLILLAVRMVPVNTTLAVSAVVLVAVINVFTGFACIMVLRLIDLQVRYSDIEPLTGLLTRAGFYEKVATLIGARSRHDDRYLVIAVVNLDLTFITVAASATL